MNEEATYSDWTLPDIKFRYGYGGWMCPFER